MHERTNAHYKRTQNILTHTRRNKSAHGGKHAERILLKKHTYTHHRRMAINMNAYLRMRKK